MKTVTAISLVEESAEKPKEEIAKVAKWVQVLLKGELFSLRIFLVSSFHQVVKIFYMLFMIINP